MAKILSNRHLAAGFFMLKAQCEDKPRPGQFYMLRAWGAYPLLSRPISVFDADSVSVSFLIKNVGKGTDILSRLDAGDELALDGPHGNGWPQTEGLPPGKIALVGGGVGIAPLYLAAKKIAEGGKKADLFLGFSEAPVLKEEYSALGRLTLDVGGFITDKVQPADYGLIWACGPEAMMRALYRKCHDASAAKGLYVSMENRMACGFGACLVCTCKTVSGNKKVCADGPVFKGEEVFGRD